VRTLYEVPDLEILYVVTVMLTRAATGQRRRWRGRALGGRYDFFFVPPDRTFA
jgi:hypothetical protein